MSEAYDHFAWTYDPILVQGAPIRRFRGADEPIPPAPGVALVLVPKAGELTAIWPTSRPRLNSLWFGSFKAYYKVDVSQHQLGIRCQLPATGDAFEFDASVNLSCSVADPIMIVRENFHSARRVLEPLLKRVMRTESRKHDLQACATAETGINNAIEDAADAIKRKVGFKLEWATVELRLDKATVTHLRNLTLMQQRFSRLTQVGPDYESLITNGKLSLLAYQLAEHPEDLGQVQQLLVALGQDKARETYEALKFLWDNNLLEGFDIDEGRKRTVGRWLEGMVKGWDKVAIDGSVEASSSKGELPEAARRKALPIPEDEDGE